MISMNACNSENTPQKYSRLKKLNQGNIQWHVYFEWMLPDLRSVYGYIPCNMQKLIDLDNVIVSPIV